MSGSASQPVGLVARRRDLLVALREGTVDKPGLVDTLGVSRSTVDRAVRELESANLVFRDGNHVSLTTTGRVLLRGYCWLEAVAAGVDRASDLLSHIPDTGVPHPTLFDGATIIEATQAVPTKPLDVLEEYLQEATYVDSVTLSVVPRMVKAFQTAVVEEGVSIRMMMPEPVVTQLVNSHQSALSSGLDAGADLRETTTTPPFGLVRFESENDSWAALLSYGDGGLRGLIGNDSPQAVAWADTYLDRWAERSRSL